jgi:hypothetical protein
MPGGAEHDHPKDMIATTTIADGIAVIVFATILFLLGAGGLWLLKFLWRCIRGKPQPVEPQSICVSFEAADEWDEEGNVLEMQRFADYLASRLQGPRLGEFDGGEFGGKRVGLHFYGPDAKRMWEVLEGEVRTHAPERPIEVVFDFGKKRGGRQVVDLADDSPHHPQPLPEFEPQEPDTGITPAWTLAWRIGNLLWLTGFLGLFLSQCVRWTTGISEGEMTRSRIGSFVVFTLSGMFIGGMVLTLVCVSHGQRVAKRPSPGPVGRAQQGPALPGWISNKVILALLAAVILGLLMMYRGGMK